MLNKQRFYSRGYDYILDANISRAKIDYPHLNTQNSVNSYYQPTKKSKSERKKAVGAKKYSYG